MARKADKETLKLLAPTLKEIQRKFRPQRVILFGSRARGDHLKDSDVDILIVSSKFNTINWRERIISVFGKWDKKQMLEPICLTPDEFSRRQKEIGIIQQAMKEGIDLLE